jgi:aerobic-type carbon monoxide dehydrogenase small subunit (CoxS/CutS family)
MLGTTTEIIRLRINGRSYERAAPVRQLLIDLLRDDLGLTGAHLGCAQGVCGSCTVLLNGEPARACLLLAAQADGCELVTIEGLAAAPGQLHPLQAAFQAKHGVQCGYCTPSMLISAAALLEREPSPSAEQVREWLAGNLCRCTGYQQIIEAVLEAAEAVRTQSAAPLND